MTDLPLITETLAQIKSWAIAHAPQVTFRPPASPAAIENFTKKSGLSCPEDLRQMLLMMDGETRQSAGMIGNWRLMPIGEIQAAWGLLSQLALKGAFADQQALPSPYIRKAWWHPAWIPIVSSDAGDYFCVDVDPLESARYGQVLLFLRNQPQRVLVAASLSAWFDRIARDLTAGIYRYTPEAGFDNEAFMRASLEDKHIFDEQRGTLIAYNPSEANR